MQELLNLIDSQISKNLSNDMSLKSAPCTVIDVLENDTIKVKLISNGAEYTVGNYSGSQVEIGETVQLFYKGIINQNSAYIGAALYKENKNSGDDIVVDSSMKNIIMNTKTGDLGNTEFSLADVYLSAKQSTDITIFFNANILGQEDNNIVFSVFVDGVEQPYKPIVSTINQLYSVVNFSTPVSLNDGIHNVEIRSSGIGIVENVCAYVAGQYIEGFSFDTTNKADCIYVSWNYANNLRTDILYYKGSKNIIQIPSIIDERPVLSISATSFNYSTVEKVYIPDGVTEIE